MSSRVTIETVPVHADARGWVVEPITEHLIPLQRNSHVVLSEPGSIRGNHYHLHATEIAVVVGPVLVRFREEGKVRDVNVPPNEAWRFTLPPGIPHAFKNTGPKPAVMVAFTTQPHDRAHPDVIRDVLIES